MSPDEFRAIRLEIRVEYTTFTDDNGMAIFVKHRGWEDFVTHQKTEIPGLLLGIIRTLELDIKLILWMLYKKLKTRI